MSTTTQVCLLFTAAVYTLLPTLLGLFYQRRLQAIRMDLIRGQCDCCAWSHTQKASALTATFSTKNGWFPTRGSSSPSPYCSPTPSDTPNLHFRSQVQLKFLDNSLRTESQHRISKHEVYKADYNGTELISMHFAQHLICLEACLVWDVCWHFFPCSYQISHTTLSVNTIKALALGDKSMRIPALALCFCHGERKVGKYNPSTFCRFWSTSQN